MGNWNIEQNDIAEGVTVYTEVTNAKSAGGVTFSKYFYTMWEMLCRRHRVLRDNWMFITQLFQWYLIHPICSVCCFVMRERAQHSQCQFQVFSMQGAATYLTSHMEWSWLLYYQRGASRSPGDSTPLHTSQAVWSVRTHTHTFIMLLCLSGGGSPREINLLMHLWCRLNENLAHHGFSALGESFFY